MAQNLYEILYNAQQNTERGKLRVGYTVGAYAGVLSALQKAEMITVENQTGELYDNTPVVTNSETVVNGFFQNGNKQAEVTFRNYMSFVVDVNADGVQSKEAVNVQNLVSSHDGNVVFGSSHILYPPAPYTKEANESLKLGTQSFGAFVIGIGISFDNLLVNFFKQFYGEMTWDAAKLEKLASQGGLYAELMFPEKDGAGQAQVIHVKVTVKATSNIDNGGYSVYVPIPLMLLNKYKGIGQVSVTVSTENGNPKEYVVDGSSVSFPYSGNSYNKSKGTIDGFKPEVTISYVESPTSVTAEYKNSTLSGKKGRIRFYFSSEMKDQIISEVGVIPEAYEQDLFRGVLPGDGNYTIEVASEAGAFTDYAGLEEYWTKLGAEVGLSAEMVARAVGCVAKKESGGDWGMWKECKVNTKSGVRGDGQGISAGYLQFTQLAGGCKDYRDFYVELQKKDPSAPAMSQAMFDDIGTYSGQDAASRLSKYKNEFRTQSSHGIGRLAQLLAWEGKGENRAKRIYTAKWFNHFKCSTAAEYKAIFGAVNHLPNYFDSKGYPKYAKYITDNMSPIEKAKMLEKIHFAGHKDHYKGNSSVQTPDPTQINSNTIGRTYRYRYNTVMKLFGDNNVNLDGWSSWS